MSFSKIMKRELEVAFSKHSQPVWFRIVNYMVLATIVYLFWGSHWLWNILLVLLITSLFLHFWYRYKTRGWTKSYGLWKHEKDRLPHGNK